MRVLFEHCRGPDVAKWQRLIGLVPDGVFGPLTTHETKIWQAMHALRPDGIVGPLTWVAAASKQDAIPFVEARHFTEGKPDRRVELVVIHTTENLERPGTARAVAHWFAGPQAPQASAHYVVGADEVVQSVLEHDVAWHAGCVNPWSIGVEHVGFARQTPEEWTDPYSEAELHRSAVLVASICARYSIPAVKLEPAQVRARDRGICGHVDVTRAFDVKGGHVDPGAHFPWARYLELVRQALPTA